MAVLDISDMGDRKHMKAPILSLLILDEFGTICIAISSN